INAAGDIVGYSVRYGAGAGNSYWLYDGQTYHTLGLTDAAHTSTADGTQGSTITRLSDSGLVIGYSGLYNGATAIGRSAWIFNGSQNIQIGLVDADHTLAGGGQSSTPNYLSSTGFVAGISTRSDLSQSAWIYDGSVTKRIGLFDAAHTSASGAQN